MATEIRLIVRAETKLNERRAPITPDDCHVLIEKGFTIYVEKSQERIFDDDLYFASGCNLVNPGSWKTAPEETYVLGLKELEEEDVAIRQKHIYFSHCYKGQAGWKELIRRFINGEGEILDVEFMIGKDGRRAVAEFSPIAGFCGCAIAIKIWCSQARSSPSLSQISAYEDQGILVSEIKSRLDKCLEDGRKLPRILIIGALGRCGRGAKSLADLVGLPSENIALWGLEETKLGGPFPELLTFDIVVNCIFLGAVSAEKAPPPFLTADLLNTNDRALTVVSDVSCDVGNPFNPLPFVDVNTTFEVPTKRVVEASGDKKPLDIISIDHLPSLLPKESSERFSAKILPYLVELKERNKSSVWKSTVMMYQQKLKELKTR